MLHYALVFFVIALFAAFLRRTTAMTANSQPNCAESPATPLNPRRLTC